eukprot:TRINITY_DN11772_c0_g1_i1.p1 TRINITY_DN11772_c0_g1~~TRINITY_DN11772_c0_g1_i1.p1  ORF type:complete len:638 (+),score=130.86 TRINITY_DN11772_c0_g1_i1:61-1974(+)
MTDANDKQISLSDRSDGVSSVTCGGMMVVYGGGISDKVWVLHLEELRWETAICTGEVPPARKHHSAVEYKGEMYVFGGVTANGTDDTLHALTTTGRNEFTWEKVMSVGRVPSPRSHHTAVMSGDNMYIFGGCQGDEPTVGSVRRLAEENFYDVYRFNITSCTWDLFCHHDTLQPCLWGHSVAPFRHFLLHFGGFNLGDYATLLSTSDMAATIADVQPPTATLNDVVFILNLHTKEWTRSSPKNGLSPIPRAMHCAFTFGSEMIVFGGIGLDHAGHANPVNDCWKWDIATGAWARIEFCLKHWKSAKLMFSIANSVFYVVQQLSSAHVLDLRMGGDWQTIACDVSGLAKPTLKRIAAPRQQHLQPQPHLPPPPPPPQPSNRFPVFHGDPRVLSPKRRREVNFEVEQRAVVKDEMQMRLREEMLTEEGFAKESSIEMLQKQIIELKQHMEEFTTTQKAALRRRPTHSPRRPGVVVAPATPSPQPAALPQPAVPPPQHPQPVQHPPQPRIDPELSKEVTRLVDAVSHLKSISAAYPTNSNPALSPMPFTYAGPISPQHPPVQQPPQIPLAIQAGMYQPLQSPSYPPPHTQVQLTPQSAPVASQVTPSRHQQHALQRMQHLSSLQRHLNDIEASAAKTAGY